MLTGLVYAAVVILWAVVLVPQWLRRHERNAEHRTTLTFHRAMRTLERRRMHRGVSRAAHDVDVVVAGARSRVHDRISVTPGRSAIDEHLDLGIDPFIGGIEEQELRDARRVRAQFRARETAAKRRKQVQQVLVGLSIVSVILLVMGMVPLLLGVLPPLLLAGYWYVARKQAAVTRATALRRERATSRPASAGASSESMSTRTSTRARQASDRRRAARRHIDQPAAVPASASAAGFESGSDVQILDNTRDDSSWEPVESPLPSYVNGPRATAIPRNLDSTSNGDWTSERMLEQVEALRTPGADAEAELGLDEYVDVPGAADSSYEHRRAVND